MRWQTGLGMLALALACRAGSSPERQPDPRGETSSEPAREPSPEPEPAPLQPPVAPERSLGVFDRGVFSDLDGSIQIALASDLDPAGVHSLIDRERQLVLLYAEHWPIKVYPLLATADAQVLTVGEQALALRPGDHAELAALRLGPEQVRRLAAGRSAPPGDRDDDGIPDPLDLWIGIRKTELDAATYDDGYQAIDYPGGDVPRDRGACVDVIVRALRNVGVDLQVELHDDLRAHPRRYPMVDEPNSDIDHRRVRTVLPWFRAHWIARTREASAEEPWRVGELVFMETMASRSGPDHIGWLFDPDPAIDPERPWVVNSWTEGYSTEAMDLLTWVPVTERFSLPPTQDHAGPVDAWTSQLIVVESDDWTSTRARVLRFERDEVGGSWQRVGEPFSIVLAERGMGWGKGRHGDGAPPGQRGPLALEGRTPAGIFDPLTITDPPLAELVRGLEPSALLVVLPRPVAAQLASQLTSRWDLPRPANTDP